MSFVNHFENYTINKNGLHLKPASLILLTDAMIMHRSYETLTFKHPTEHLD